MSVWWVVLVVVVLALLFVARKGVSSSAASGDFPYQKRPVLLTPAERSFLGVLEQAVSGRYRIQVQVRLADLMTVRAGLAPARRTMAQNRINGKHADFVLCDPATLAILAAIELDDASHQQAARQARDRFLEGACAAAGLPLLRFEARAAYGVGEVRARIAQALGDGVELPRELPVTKPGVSTPGVVAPVALESGPLLGAAVMAGDVPPGGVPAVIAAPACPRCGGAMVLRQMKQGAHAGKRLWGCQKFPACRGVVLAG